MDEIQEPTAEEIQRHYNAALDSVNLINELMAKKKLTANELLRIKANKEHLRIMLAKTFWTEQQDLTPLRAVV